MKRTHIFLFLVVGFFQACTNDPILTISNPSEESRVDEAVTLTRTALEEKMESLNPDHKVVPYLNGSLLPCQHDDLDGDGKWDELFFLIDIAGEETLKLALKAIPTAELPDFETRTNIHFAKKIITGEKVEYENLDSAKRLAGTDTKVTQKYFQYEGPGWENDKVAFRNYFDQRNGMDIFGKTTDEMTLHKAGIDKSYHELQDWGMDILKVGNSLGAGAIALEKEGTLYRVASENSNFNIVAEGPLRSVMDFDFEDVNVDSITVDLKHRISIPAGAYYYDSEVTIESEEDVSLVSGIVNMQSDSLLQITGDEHTMLYTFDNQAYDGEKLGMGILVQSNDLIGSFKTPDEGEGITQTFGVLFTGSKTQKFRFYGCWELSNKEFFEWESMNNFFDREVALVSQPLGIQ